MPRTKKAPITYCFIDAANLFYGGEKSLGWSIDYQKLINYLKLKYQVKKCFYYAGIDIFKFTYDPLAHNSINLSDLLGYLMSQKNKSISPAINRVKFYLKLQKFGYTLRLKPTKIYHQNQHLIKKANCDVDLTFDLMRLFDQYSQTIILSGDGDFFIVLSYLIHKGKSVNILSRSERTAKEIRRLAGGNFRDFTKLRNALEYNQKK